MNLGKRLLSTGNFLAKYVDRVPLKIGEEALALWRDDPKLTQDDLIQELIATFGLTPLRLGALRSVLVYVPEREFRTRQGIRRGHVAEARVPYSGSAILWQASPSPDLAFPYRGLVAKATAGLRGFSANKDLAPFEHEVQDALVRTRAALEAYAPKVLDVDQHIRSEITHIVRTL